MSAEDNKVHHGFPLLPSLTQNPKFMVFRDARTLLTRLNWSHQASPPSILGQVQEAYEKMRSHFVGVQNIDFRATLSWTTHSDSLRRY